MSDANNVPDTILAKW